jgi:pimeloyl-ACP methyl ester carboxylesterase
MRRDLRRGKLFRPIGRSRKATTICLTASALAGAAFLFGVPASNAAAPPPCQQNPIIFVHGIEGSGAQFESQKMRFMSNGYTDPTCFDEVDYNSTRAVGDKSEVHQQIDAAIANLKPRSPSSQVDVVAHSLGTTVMYEYLTEGASAADRRANVAHYINVDGQSQNPGVPTLAVWAGRGTPGRNMDGAENVTIPNQTHVQACTSAEAFVEYYEYLTGSPPANDIVPETGPIEIAGKALDFPVNTGLAGATVQIWNVDDAGQRIAAAAFASVPITDGSQGGGAWGPVTIEAGTRYEFALVRTGLPTLHVYYEPFVRSDYTLRLLSSNVVETYAGYRPGSVSSVNIRYKEIWGDQGAESDQLLIDGLSVCTPGLCPISKQVNAFFAFDRNRDGKTDLSSPDPVLGRLPFIQGADVFVAADSPPVGAVSFQLRSRGAGPVRTLNTPNWDSLTEGIIIQWNDFELPLAVGSGGSGGGDTGGSGGGSASGGNPGAGVRNRAKRCRKRGHAKKKKTAQAAKKKKKKRCGKKKRHR